MSYVSVQLTTYDSDPTNSVPYRLNTLRLAGKSDGGAAAVDDFQYYYERTNPGFAWARLLKLCKHLAVNGIEPEEATLDLLPYGVVISPAFLALLLVRDSDGGIYCMLDDFKDVAQRYPHSLTHPAGIYRACLLAAYQHGKYNY